MSESHPTASPVYQSARALVLGASGFIGRWVARRLTEEKATLIVAVRDPLSFGPIAQAWGIRAEVVRFNALDGLERVISEVVPDIVFNLVGYGVDRTETEPILMWRINRDLVRQVGLALLRTKVSNAWESGRRLVHVGSALEYGLVTGTAREDGVAEPHTEYGRSKLAGTAALAEVGATTGLNAVTARAFTVFGPGEHPGRLLSTIRRAALDGTTVRLSAGTQLRDFCYVDDVADGLLRLGRSPGVPGEVVNLASGRMTTVRTFAEMAAREMGLPDTRLQFGAEPIRDDEMRVTGVDVARLRGRTGWSPTALPADGIRRSVGFDALLAGLLPRGT